MIPEYLKKGWRKKRWRRLAKYRLGNKMRVGRYWEEEERRKCKLCEWEEKNTNGENAGSERGRKGELTGSGGMGVGREGER